MKKSIRDILDGDIPSDVPQWIVEFHDENDDPNLTPLQVAGQALQNTRRGHGWHVCHVRSGLEWSVDLETGDVIETCTMKFEVNLPGLAPWRRF